MGVYGASVSLSKLYLPQSKLEELNLHLFFTTADKYTLFIAFATSIYVVVRGFDNIVGWIENRVKKDKLKQDKEWKGARPINQELETS